MLWCRHWGPLVPPMQQLQPCCTRSSSGKGTPRGNAMQLARYARLQHAPPLYSTMCTDVFKYTLPRCCARCVVSCIPSTCTTVCWEGTTPSTGPPAWQCRSGRRFYGTLGSRPHSATVAAGMRFLCMNHLPTQWCLNRAVSWLQGQDAERVFNACAQGQPPPRAASASDKPRSVTLSYWACCAGVTDGIHLL